MKKKYAWGIVIFLALLIITYFSGPVLTQPEYEEELPQLSISLSEVEELVESNEKKAPVREDNQARILWNDSSRKVTEYAFLYLHGFAGSYRDGYPLNKIVANHFHSNIYMARLPGHGLLPQYAMNDFNAEEAWESACAALAITATLGKKVIILSTSTGGTLALKLAAVFPDKVHALINISPNIDEKPFGSGLLNTPWGNEIAHLIFLGNQKKVKHEEDSASLYWDTIYPVDALIDLEQLLETTMKPETYSRIECPVLTLYYYDNFLEKDDHVDVSVYPEVHEQLGTPTDKKHLVRLETPGTHFIGSSIKSQDYQSALKVIYMFCEEVLGMEPAS